MRYEIKINNKKSYLYNNKYDAIQYAENNNLKVFDRVKKKEIFPYKAGWKSFIGGIK